MKGKDKTKEQLINELAELRQRVTELEGSKRKWAEDLIRAQHDLALKLGATVGLDDTLRLCVEATVHSTGMDAGGVYLVDEISGDLDLAFSQGLSPDFVRVTSHYDADSPSARLVIAGKPIYINYQELDVPMDEVRRRESLRVAAILPIHHEGQVIACLNTASRSLGEIPATARHTLETIAAQIGSFVARARAEEALRQNEAQLQAILDYSPALISIKDLKGNVTLVNRNFEVLDGPPPEEFVGKNVYDLFPTDVAKALWKNDLAALEAGRPMEAEEIIAHKDGTLHTYLTVKFPLYGETDQAFGICAISTDITKRKRTEQLWQSLNQAALAMEKALTPDEIFAAVAEELKKLGFFCTIFLTDENRNVLVTKYLNYGSRMLKAAEKLAGIKAEDFSIPIEAADVWREVVYERRTVFIERVEDLVRQLLPEPTRRFAGQIVRVLKLAQFIIAPLIVKDDVIGVLTVQSANLAENDLATITAFAHQIAAAWRKAQLLEQAQTHSRYLETLQRINATLRSTLPLDKVLETIARGAGEALDYTGSLIIVPDTKGERLVLGAVWGSRFLDAAVKFTGLEVGSFSVPMTAAENPMAQAYLTGELFSWVGNPEWIVAGVEPTIPQKLAPVIARTMGAKLGACVPLPVSDKVVGVLVVFSPREQFSDEERATLLGLADQAGLAIQNAQLYQTAQQELAERKRAEEGQKEALAKALRATHALRESEEKSRNIIESIPVGMHMYQLEPDGRLVFTGANPAADDILGVDNSQFVGKTIEEAFPALAETEVPERYRLAASEGHAWHTDQIIYEENQIAGAFEVHAFQTSPGRMVAAFVDITEHKQAEEERSRLLAQIQEQAQRVQQIVDIVPEGVLLLDAEGQVILANPMAEKDLRTLAGATVGDTLTHLGNRSLAELLTSPPKGLWHEVVTDGRSFQIIARPIETGPMPGGWVLVVRDVTQQREFERRIQQQERLASVGQLAAGIAHDFNNIMATIILYAQMTARAEGLSARVRERMETINQQAGHATNLIRQILDFGRRTVLERRPLDLLPLLKAQVKLLERTLPESIEITLIYGPDEYTVDADPTSMQQAVTNLALNARDAMPGGGKLQIGLERIRIQEHETVPLPEMEAGEWVQMTISDTGMGIPPEALPHIFEPFFTTKASGVGSGLGLAQVHGIVGSHEGYIDVESRMGEGTTFAIYLPALPLYPPEPSRSEMEPVAKGQEETILVVEDNTTAREALVESLEQLNYRILEAANGREALAILEQHGDEIALVLSDVVMPEMGGIALLHALRERGIEVSIVMLTGHPMKKELETLRAQGMRDWLPKPPSLEQLAEVVNRVLNEARTSS